ncbi:MAG: flagellar biosynthetic protein FliO [Chitinispirillales bacterium]|jgi:flagellar biosynthetic protein FliO|nr:flagellar biosynthetic protein FliO [Chitinispirillales bacterium]
MKIFKSLLNAAILLSVLVIVFPIRAQDDNDIGGFDINRVYEEATSVDDIDTDAPPLFGAGADSPMRQPENYALVLLRIVGYLVIVTALVFAIAWGFRKFGIAGAPKMGGGNNMDVIETIYLGQNRGTTLVRVGNIVYLLGHTPENIVLLEKIEGEKAIELIASSKGGSTIVSFKDAFNNFLGKMKR